MNSTTMDAPEGVAAAGLDRPAGGEMGSIVDRTCTEVTAGNDRNDATESKPLSAFRGVPAYVLLGDPGSGKTTEFERESEALGDAALMLSSRDFVTFDPDDHPEWRNKTLFVDGLDEMRAGAVDARSTLDEIRRRLDQLGRPPFGRPQFRISCREADWLGRNDRQALSAVSPDSRIAVLRLDQLTVPAIRELLSLEHPTLDAQAFLEDALRFGIYPMLGNPLTLNLLATAVAPGGDWPDSRLKTFERGCLQMACERNPEHLAAARGGRASTVVNDRAMLLEAAGYLCTLALLAGKDGFSLEPGVTGSSFVSLNNIESIPGDPSREHLRAALASGLLRATGGGFVPLHRQIAEFLAGRHLSERISDGLPARRVVALMASPGDGRVVTALRGLSAWLAAHSPEARRLLIDADPVGVILYGDIGEFTTVDKESLLLALEKVAPHEPLFAYEWPEGSLAGDPVEPGWACRSLASADMAEPIKEFLGRRGGDAPDERVERLILSALSHADESEREFLCDLLPDLSAHVRDDAWPPELRRSALDAYLHLLSPGNPRAETLIELLDDLRKGTVSDPDGELTGTLLHDLYPARIQPARVWRYLPGQGTAVFGQFWRFWQHHLLERSSDDEVAELLDALVGAVRAGDFPIAPHRVESLYLELLARGLSARGETMDTERLYRWLSIPVVNDLRFEPYRFSDEPIRRVRSWLESHPEAQKAAFLARLRHRTEADDARRHHWGDLHLLHGSSLPADFGLWCLEKATEIGDAEPALSGELLRYSFSSLDDPSLNKGLTLDAMCDQTQGQHELALLLERLCEPPSRDTEPTQDHHLRELDRVEAQQREEERQRREGWVQLLRLHEKELRENRFSPPNLHHLANAYLGLFSDADAQVPPRHRLVDFVGHDEVAVDAALAGLRGAVRREDIPDVTETISLHQESQQSWLAYPVLASLELLDEEDPALLDNLDYATKRKALAIYYCSSAVVEVTRRWYDRWLQQDRDLVLGVLRRCAISAIRNGQDLPDRLRELDAVENHEGPSPGARMVYLGTGVGPRVVGNDDDLVHDLRLQLLRAFPLRAPNEQLFLLEGLLTEVLEHEDTASLNALVEQKLSRTSMSVGQRVRWLAVDAALSSVPGLPRLKSFIGDSEARARHLVTFLSDLAEFEQRRPDRTRSVWSILSKSREPATLRVLIEILGPLFAPTDWTDYFSTEQAMCSFVSTLIGQLGSISDDEAGRALTELIDDPRLTTWHGHLNWSRGRHRIVNRDASYRHWTLDEIQGTLDNQAPANATDLAALLSDRLAELAKRLRGDNSNLWRQFWNEDSSGRPTEPKPENSCRDALVETLRGRPLPGVRLEPERRHAGETRADIEAICTGFNVPVEIKKNSHPDLSSALRSQLIAKYTNDPDTDGYGIYLVLWFGVEKKRLRPNGTRPATPEDLEKQLQDQLTPDEARTISVIVMDVTKPGDRQESGTASEMDIPRIATSGHRSPVAPR